MENKYTKLSLLVDDTFQVKGIKGQDWKMWDTGSNRMILSDAPKEGFRKTYTLDTDKGLLDVGAGQLGNLLEAVFYNGVADMVGATYEVKSNGKTGMEIRYFFNVKKQETKEQPKYEKVLTADSYKTIIEENKTTHQDEAREKWGKPKAEVDDGLMDIPF